MTIQVQPHKWSNGATVLSYLISLPSVVELVLNEDWFWHGDLGFSTSSSEDDLIRCDNGDEANGKFVGSKVDIEISVLVIWVLAVTAEFGWWSSASVSSSKIKVKS